MVTTSRRRNRGLVGVAAAIGRQQHSYAVFDLGEGTSGGGSADPEGAAGGPRRLRSLSRSADCRGEPSEVGAGDADWLEASPAVTDGSHAAHATASDRGGHWRLLLSALS